MTALILALCLALDPYTTLGPDETMDDYYVVCGKPDPTHYSDLGPY